MDVELVEQMLRALPGVLDCSVSDEGIAIVVHPEVELGMLEVRAQAALAELGERRPLLVVGGMTGAAAAAGFGPMGSGGFTRGVHRAARNRSSMPIVGFAVLVVAALTVLPLASRDTPEPDEADREVAAPPVSAAGPQPAPARGLPSFGPLPITDERVVAALAPTFTRPLGEATAAVGFVRRAMTPSAARPAPLPTAPPATAPPVDVGTATPVVPTPSPSPVPVLAAERGQGSGKAAPMGAAGKPTKAAKANKGGTFVATDLSGRPGKAAKPNKEQKSGKALGRR